MSQWEKTAAVEKILFGLAFLAFAILFSLNSHYLSSCPANPSVQRGQIYPLDNHGKIVYLTKTENNKILFAEDSFFGILLLGAGLHVVNWGLRKLNVS